MGENQDFKKYIPLEGEITMFSTTWCGYCKILKSHLTRENIKFNEINIELDNNAADLVEKVNNGNRTVPTVIFPDGSAKTNPSILEVKSALNK